jgi:hypothetical protein
MMKMHGVNSVKQQCYLSHTAYIVAKFSLKGSSNFCAIQKICVIKAETSTALSAMSVCSRTEHMADTDTYRCL